MRARQSMGQHMRDSGRLVPGAAHTCSAPRACHRSVMANVGAAQNDLRAGRQPRAYVGCLPGHFSLADTLFPFYDKGKKITKQNICENRQIAMDELPKPFGSLSCGPARSVLTLSSWSLIFCPFLSSSYHFSTAIFSILFSVDNFHFVELLFKSCSYITAHFNTSACPPHLPCSAYVLHNSSVEKAIRWRHEGLYCNIDCMFQTRLIDPGRRKTLPRMVFSLLVLPAIIPAIIWLGMGGVWVVRVAVCTSS